MSIGISACGAYQTLQQVVKSERVRASENPLFSTIRQPGVGDIAAAGLPLEFSKGGARTVEAAPQLGAHTDEVLMSVLGMTSGEIGRLHDAAVIENAS